MMKRFGVPQIDKITDNMEKTFALMNEPMDYALWDQAEKNVENRGQISPKAVQDEYNRLMLERLFPPRQSLWARLFGR